MCNKNGFILITLYLLSSSAVSEEAQFGSPEAVNNRIAEDSKNREQPLKDQLANKGINLAVDYSSVALSASDVLEGSDDTAASGMLRFYGSWDLLNKDTPNTGGLIWKLEHRHSYTDTSVKDFEFGAGGLGLITPPFSDQGTRLTNLYWRQRFNNGNTTIVAGFLDSTDHLDVYALASPWTGFMNFAFSTGTTTVALPGDAALGLAGATILGDKWFVIAGITDMESDPTDPLNGFDSFFSDEHHFKSIELGHTSSKDNIYTNNIHLTLWQADESLQQGSSAGQGAVFSASQMMGKWLPFFRAGISEDAGTLAEKSVSTGFGYYGLGGKSNTFGAAINWADTGTSDNQITMEAFYLIKPLPFFEITPDIQLIMNPTLNPDEDQILIFGLRSRLVW